MPLDPAAQGLLDLIEQLGVPPIDAMTPQECRAAFAALRDPTAPVAEVASAVETVIRGVPVRVYTPFGPGPFPVLLWLHGGGWVIGSAEQSDPTARELCRRAGCLVVSVDYRLAPEHVFPAGLDDVLEVARWLRSNAAELGGDPDRLAVGGDSAGGNLSAVAAQQLPGVFRFQALIYPVTDLTFSHESYVENADGYLLTRNAMVWFREHYLRGVDVDPADSRLSPLWASDEVIARQPPAFVLTCGYDPLRDEGNAYADRLRKAGVPVEHVSFPDQIHGFFGMHLAIPAAYDALDATARALRRAFDTAAD